MHHEILTPTDVARLEEPRQARWVTRVCRRWEAVAGGVVGSSGAGNWINTAVALGLAGPVTPAEVDRVIAFFESEGIEPRFEVCPDADASLIVLLGERGFRIKFFEHVLARRLSGSIDAIVPEPDGLSIRRVNAGDEADVRLFATTAVSGFVPTGQEMTELMLELPMREARRPEALNYLAFIGDQAAGAGSASADGEVGSLFGVSVLPPFRRRGVQQHLLAHRLRELRERGVKVATIGSLPGSPTARNVLRMGFAVAYTKVGLVRPGPGLVPTPV